MYSNFLSTALVALYAGTALAADDSSILRCGTGDPPDDFLDVAKTMARESASVGGRTIEVETYFHVVTTEDHKGTVTDEMLSDQLGVLNSDYAPHGISFVLIDTDYTVNDSWATGLYNDIMKPQLRQGTYADLNLYFLSDLSHGDLLGSCQFPGIYEDESAAYYEDGCDILAGALPGGTSEHFNAGGTATHEVGHWFGLLHVFHGGSCTGDGDNVWDTPPQVMATRGCPVVQDSCPDVEGSDNIHNYMDYGYDECYTEFTEGQATRMFLMWDVYRAGN